jgi:three-Cys-motif partner protein
VTSADGMGLGQQSAQKFEDFRGVAHIVVNKAFGALRKWPSWRRPFSWVDLTSGPGLDPYPDGSTIEGTPIIGMDELRDARSRLNVPFEAWFFEQHVARCDDLEYELRHRYGAPIPQGDYQVLNGDARLCLEQLTSSGQLQGTLGAFVYDPTEQVDLDFLADIASTPSWKRYDLLVYVSAASIKRPRNLPANYQTDRRTLIQRLQTIPKQKWIVRRPSGPSEWSWFVGTNDSKFPEWPQHGFFDVTLSDGKRILDQLNLTHEERHLRDHGGGLFGA